MEPLIRVAQHHPSHRDERRIPAHVSLPVDVAVVVRRNVQLDRDSLPLEREIQIDTRDSRFTGICQTP
jgi:hypothetical protein